MYRSHSRFAPIGLILILPTICAAQGTLSDYQRALTLRDRYQGLAYNLTDQRRWIYNTHKL